MQQLGAREIDFIRKQTAIVQKHVGTVMEIRTSSGALRKGVVESVEFDHFERTASGKSLFIVWKITQQIARADGNGSVPRSLTIRL